MDTAPVRIMSFFQLLMGMTLGVASFNMPATVRIALLRIPYFAPSSTAHGQSPLPQEIRGAHYARA